MFAYLCASSADQLPVVCLEGHQVTIDYFEKNGFHNPILVDNIDGLNLQVPPSNFSIHKVEELVGKWHSVQYVVINKWTNNVFVLVLINTIW